MAGDVDNVTGYAIRRGLAACLAVAAIVTGCASTASDTGRTATRGTEPRAERVMLARAGSELAIEWKTRTNVVYALVYKARPGPQQPWRPVEGYERIHGTGRTMTITLPSWPGDSRRFTVMSAPEWDAHRLPGGQRRERAEESERPAIRRR